MSRRRLSDANGDKLTGLFGGTSLSLGNNEDKQDTSRPSALRVKIISMGESGVGKSCVIKRYCEEKFVSKYISTIGIDYGVKPVMVNGAEVRVNFWDLSGLPEYLEVRNEFYKDTQGGILTFDVSSRKSFEALDSWLREAGKFGAGKFPCILCGNKIDRPRAVSEDEGRAYAHSKGFEYFETSACTGVNITEAFHSLFRTVVKHVTR
ncbi:DnaJ sub C member 27 [Phytophthora pseudosyringae]|uniref:DnaJ sub C member 27 n=1 Tax=Phytophthora pseudosyringae TaxID=221518 RepID=A0A8T1VCL4_9STRA|nr:DnaJ sub C member 27 [Phytophthora pseudosyringae]